MIEVGDIWSLKALLGHADIQTTQRYAHLSERNYRLPVLSWTHSNERGKEGGGFPEEISTLNPRSKQKLSNILLLKPTT